MMTRDLRALAPCLSEQRQRTDICVRREYTGLDVREIRAARRRSVCTALAILLMAIGRPAAAQTPSPSRPPAGCVTDSVYRVLDFWVGEWTVVDPKGAAAGKSRIEKIVDGCAIVEHWTDVDGWEGKSLFYVAPATRRWKQVWVTPQARSVGGTKEKSMLALLADGSVRFQGELVGPLGRVILDRTTLTPQSDGTVRQVIEVSRDGGGRWDLTFDAVYHRR